MVLIHRKTFDILKSVPDNMDQEAYFSCDEEIAPVIRLLNLKGYTTEFCCSGHLYDEITDTLVIDETEMTEEMIRKTLPGILKVNRENDHEFRLVLRQNLCMQTYITFKKEVVLPSIPDGFYLRGSTLLHNYYWDDSFEHPYAEKELQENSPYTFFSRRLEILTGLYQWAEGLEENRSE